MFCRQQQQQQQQQPKNKRRFFSAKRLNRLCRFYVPLFVVLVYGKILSNSYRRLDKGRLDDSGAPINGALSLEPVTAALHNDLRQRFQSGKEQGPVLRKSKNIEKEQSPNISEKKNGDAKKDEKVSKLPINLTEPIPAVETTANDDSQHEKQDKKKESVEQQPPANSKTQHEELVAKVAETTKLEKVISAPKEASKNTTADNLAKEVAKNPELTTLQRYEKELAESIVPDPSLPTLGFAQRTFYSGYRNEAMAFTYFIMYAKENNYSQIFLPGLRWKDLFGTNKPVPHEVLFDVVHWNSFYPALPRFVGYHPSFENVHPKSFGWVIPENTTATKPYIFGRQIQLFNKYKQYTKRVQATGEPRSPTEILMLQGALRPNPLIEEIISGLHESRHVGEDGKRQTYMSLHARVEPDMQRHTPCRDYKVRELSRIINMVENKFEAPSSLVIALSREILEEEGLNVTLSNNTLAGENLRLLNKMRDEGLWGGRVPVYEAGSSRLADIPYFRNALSIGGSVLNFFLAVEADVFIGTRVLSYSTDVIATRFFRNLTENYFYMPHGLERAYDPVKDHAPPRFAC